MSHAQGLQVAIPKDHMSMMMYDGKIKLKKWFGLNNIVPAGLVSELLLRVNTSQRLGWHHVVGLMFDAKQSIALHTYWRPTCLCWCIFRPRGYGSVSAEFKKTAGSLVRRMRSRKSPQKMDLGTLKDVIGWSGTLFNWILPNLQKASYKRLHVAKLNTHSHAWKSFSDTPFAKLAWGFFSFKAQSKEKHGWEAAASLTHTEHFPLEPLLTPRWDWRAQHHFRFCAGDFPNFPGHGSSGGQYYGSTCLASGEVSSTGPFKKGGALRWKRISSWTLEGLYELSLGPVLFVNVCEHVIADLCVCVCLEFANSVISHRDRMPNKGSWKKLALKGRLGFEKVNALHFWKTFWFYSWGFVFPWWWIQFYRCSHASQQNSCCKRHHRR